ncbi:integrase [Sporolactobacillus shoreae]|uniref:Integrase n=1 Tax=Sporolactobacillus shoreae TaxID=1465501 RepID=A0A4Z0GR66_9BACL|nr:tyrosine-type recombinase/integrase [Sporolactobacillus shoreae]TGA99027.1 integrase [Sporolactobacillus shoreae]
MRRKMLTEEQQSLIDRSVKIDDEGAIEEFIRSRRLKNVRETTITYYKNVIHVLKRDMAQLKINKQLIELTESDVEDIILLWKSKIKITSINSKLRGIRPFFSFMKEKKMIRKDPTANIKLLRERKQIRATLEDFEVKKIADYFKKQKSFSGYRNLVMFYLLLDTGIRISECIGIQINDVDGSRLIVRETKNLQQRLVFLSKNMVEKLQSYIKVRGQLSHDYLFINCDDRVLCKSSFQAQLREAAREVGITKQVSPHVCRRTYAKNAVMRGMDPFSLAMLLGHQSIEITKRYVQIWGSDLEVQAEKKHDYSGIF